MVHLENICECYLDSILENNELLLLKCKISAIWLVEKLCIFLIYLIATVQISMKCHDDDDDDNDEFLIV